MKIFLLAVVVTALFCSVQAEGNHKRRKRFHQLRKVAKSEADALVAASTSASLSSSTRTPCPCDHPSHCLPISGPPVRQREIYGFNAFGDWEDENAFGWQYATTVAWAHNASFVCAAHSHGVRVVMAAPSINMTAMIEPSSRATWVASANKAVTSNFFDGIVFDFESPLPQGSKEAEAYALLIGETRDALHKISSSYQISTCTAWSPDDIDGRGYDMAALAAASDLLYVMDYDTRSQVFDHCLASANAPLPGMIRGITRYFDLGISAQKLVLGVPWYGYRYECEEGTDEKAVFCPIDFVPFRGVNCSDAAGSEYDLQRILNEAVPNATTTMRRDANMRALYFNTKDEKTGKTVQWWFDVSPKVSCPTLDPSTLDRGLTTFAFGRTLPRSKKSSYGLESTASSVSGPSLLETSAPRH